MDDAIKCHHDGVCIAIGSVKAHDHVNEKYICLLVLLDRQDPPAYITCIRRFFLNTQIVINLSGFMQQAFISDVVGDAISLFLFSYALEPLVRRAIYKIHVCKVML
ncbi:hypothetical protein V8B55DRAFT_1032545 [Mucor lusitanicus]